MIDPMFAGANELYEILAAPLESLWAGGMAAAFHIYSRSATFWAVVGGCFLATAGLTPVVMEFARRNDFVDHGGFRKITSKSTPLLGGIAVAIPFLCVCAFGIMGGTSLFRQISDKQNELWAITLGSILILSIGVFDDVRGMAVRIKFMLQVLAALVFCSFGYIIHFIVLPGVGTIHLGPILGTFFTLIWIVGITNAINIIDGLDGLASGIALIATFGLGCIAAFNGMIFAVLLCAGLAGSLTAFLLYNFHPARIFLGDTGSLFLGFTLATISLTGSMKASGAVILIAPMMALGLPIFEVGLSMLRRRMNGVSMTSADAAHLHHCLLKRGFSQRGVALMMYGGGLVCLIAALFIATNTSQKAIFLVFPLALYSVGMLSIGLLSKSFDNLNVSPEVRRRNEYRQTLTRFIAQSINTGASLLGVNALLEIVRVELKLRLLHVMFCEPAQTLGSCGTASSSGDLVLSGSVLKTLMVKTPNGENLQIRFQYEDGLDAKEQNEIQWHLGQLFEHAILKRPKPMFIASTLVTGFEKTPTHAKILYTEDSRIAKTSN